jgi:cell wall assembly regulator SMI1
LKDILEKLEALTLKEEGRSMNLRKGNAESSINKAEKKLKMKFPDDFHEYLLLHDGQDDDENVAAWRLANLDEIIEQWKDERNAEEEFPEGDDVEFSEDGKMMNRQRCDKWIPFLGAPNWDQNIFYIDLSPGTKGKSGQVIVLDTECDFKVCAPSFTAFIKKWLKNGEPS